MLLPRAVALAATIALVSCGGAGGAGSPSPPSGHNGDRPAKEGEVSGTGARNGGDEARGAADGVRSTTWELASALSSLRRATPRDRSQHMNGDLEGEVLANAEAKAYPALGPLRSLPPGAILVETHYRPGSSDPEVLFVMAKQPPGFDPDGGDWEYMVVEPGGMIAQRGRIALCARCHAEAPHDRVFGGRQRRE